VQAVTAAAAAFVVIRRVCGAAGPAMKQPPAILPKTPPGIVVRVTLKPPAGQPPTGLLQLTVVVYIKFPLTSASAVVGNNKTAAAAVGAVAAAAAARKTLQTIQKRHQQACMLGVLAVFMQQEAPAM
jgi:hypothetical protein